MAGGQLLHGGFNGLHATVGTSLVGGHVGVQTGAVPVTRNGFRGKSNLGTEFLGHTVQQETRHPELVAERDAGAGTDLVLPLCGHDFGVGA